MTHVKSRSTHILFELQSDGDSRVSKAAQSGRSTVFSNGSGRGGIRRSCAIVAALVASFAAPTVAFGQTSALPQQMLEALDAYAPLSLLEALARESTPEDQVRVERAEREVLAALQGRWDLRPTGSDLLELVAEIRGHLLPRIVSAPDAPAGTYRERILALNGETGEAWRRELSRLVGPPRDVSLSIFLATFEPLWSQGPPESEVDRQSKFLSRLASFSPQQALRVVAAANAYVAPHIALIPLLAVDELYVADRLDARVFGEAIGAYGDLVASRTQPPPLADREFLVTGVVLTDAGEPAAGVTVVIVTSRDGGDGYPDYFPPGETPLTDHNGRFKIPMRLNTGRTLESARPMSVWAFTWGLDNDFSSETKSVSEWAVGRSYGSSIDVDVRSPVTLQLQDVGTLDVEVSYAGGKLAELAQIRTALQDSVLDLYFGYYESHGSVDRLTLPQGKVTLKVQPERSKQKRYLPQVLEIDVKPGQNETLRVVLDET